MNWIDRNIVIRLELWWNSSCIIQVNKLLDLNVCVFLSVKRRKNSFLLYKWPKVIQHTLMHASFTTLIINSKPKSENNNFAFQKVLFMKVKIVFWEAKSCFEHLCHHVFAKSFVRIVSGRQKVAFTIDCWILYIP